MPDNVPTRDVTIRRMDLLLLEALKEELKKEGISNPSSSDAIRWACRQCLRARIQASKPV